MKKNIDIMICCIGVFVLLSISACKKHAFEGAPLASLTVINAIVGGQPIRVGSIVTAVGNNASQQLTILSGDNDLYVWPVGDSSSPYYTYSKFQAEEWGIYSLFLAGQSPAITGILVNDNMPYHTDSTCGIRFINLIPDSAPLNISITATPNTNLVSNLAYLQYTDFKLFPAKATNTGYTFQIRKASDNTILFNYSLPAPFPRFTNVTLVLRGLNSSIGVTRVNNER